MVTRSSCPHCRAAPAAHPASTAPSRPADARRLAPTRPRTGREAVAGAALAFVALLATLAALAGILLTMAGPLAVPDRPAAAGDGASGAVVRRFYAAVNAALAGDGTTALRAVAGLDLVLHRAGGDDVDPGGLAARLEALRQIAPDLRYSVDEVVADDDRVAVRLTVTGGPGTSWSTAALPGGGWSGTEVLRLSNDWVAEYWPAPVELAVSRHAEALTIPRPGERTELSVVRFSLRPGATLNDLAGPVGHLVVPESGPVAVELARPARVWRGDAPRLGWQATDDRVDERVPLAPGDAMLVPPDVRHTIQNDDDAPVTVVGAAILPLDGPADGEGKRLRNLPPLVAVYRTTRLGVPQPVGAAGGVEGTRLAVAFAVCRAAVAERVGLAWEPLLPGATIPAHPVGGQEVVVPTQGAVGYAGEPPTIRSQALSVPGLGFATARGIAPALAPQGSLAARVLVVTVDPVLATLPGHNTSDLARPPRVAGCGGTA